MIIRTFEKPDEFLAQCKNMLEGYDALYLRYLKGDYPSDEEILELQTRQSEIKKRFGMLESMTKQLYEVKNYDISDFVCHITDVIFDERIKKFRFKYEEKSVNMTSKQFLSNRSFRKKIFEHTGENITFSNKVAYNRIRKWFTEIARSPTEPKSKDIESVRIKLTDFLPNNIVNDKNLDSALLGGVISENIDGEQYFLFAREQVLKKPYTEINIRSPWDLSRIFEILGVKFQGFWNLYGRWEAIYRVKMSDLSS